jgi:hypothetical protein
VRTKRTVANLDLAALDLCKCINSVTVLRIKLNIAGVSTAFSQRLHRVHYPAGHMVLFGTGFGFTDVYMPNFLKNTIIMLHYYLEIKSILVTARVTSSALFHGRKHFLQF